MVLEFALVSWLGSTPNPTTHFFKSNKESEMKNNSYLKQCKKRLSTFNLIIILSSIILFMFILGQIEGLLK